MNASIVRIPAARLAHISLWARWKAFWRRRLNEHSNVQFKIERIADSYDRVQICWEDGSLDWVYKDKKRARSVESMREKIDRESNEKQKIAQNRYNTSLEMLRAYDDLKERLYRNMIGTNDDTDAGVL